MYSKIVFFTCLAISMLAVGCSTSVESADSGSQVKIDDGYKVNDSNEIALDDSAFADKTISVSTTTPSSDEGVRIAGDKSEISTLKDGHGNVTETRKFLPSERIKMLILRRAADGKTQVFVYGQSGMVKQLPAEMHPQALTASADEIANKLGMYGSAPIKLRQMNSTRTTLRPKRSSDFPLNDRAARNSSNPQQNEANED